MSKAAMAQAWSAIHVGDGRFLLYGPRFGRAYLRPRGETKDPGFLRLIGLEKADFHDALLDPADRIDTTLQNAAPGRSSPAPWRYVFGYRLLHHSRHVIPLRMAARALRRMAVIRRRRAPGAPIAIADTLYAVERAAGAGDCYPRALLTAYLALKSGQACTLIVGALTPTRKMHVWCVVDEAIPYEPSPEHYLYQPLWTLRLTP